MDLKEIQSLIKLVSSNSVDELEIERKDFKLSIKKNAKEIVTATTQPQVIQAVAPQTMQAIQPVAPAPAAPAESKASAEPKSDNLITIKSPMIGTFYRQAKPDTPPFVNVGDEIAPGKVLCIVEAMKLFNEIESEVSGKIVKILVDNNSPVQYDQPLFLVEP